jgi:hypothetical protein
MNIFPCYVDVTGPPLPHQEYFAITQGQIVGYAKARADD